MSDPDLPRLSEEQCARYRDDGFVFLPNLISERDIDRARDELDRVVPAHPRRGHLRE